jgi:hypothetical protein
VVFVMLVFEALLKLVVHVLTTPYFDFYHRYSIASKHYQNSCNTEPKISVL